MNLWRDQNWHTFSEKVKRRDGHRCVQCHRSDDVVLQVHHRRYVPGRSPWEYDLDDCETLCKGCHAREHGIIEPIHDWQLVDIDDLEDLSGSCERCGTAIRYPHLIYHPGWGYQSVGSRCMEHLTSEDQAKSRRIRNLYKKASLFAKEKLVLLNKSEENYHQIVTKHSELTVDFSDESITFGWFERGQTACLPLRIKGIDLECCLKLAYLYRQSQDVCDEKLDEIRHLYQETKERHRCSIRKASFSETVKLNDSSPDF